MTGFILAASLAYALVAVFKGAPPTTRFPADDFIWFDGTLRFAAHQGTATDFYNPLGPLYFQVPAWIMDFAGRSVLSFQLAMAAFALGLGLLTHAACRHRLPPLFGAALVVLTMAFLLSLRGYGYEFHALTFAAYYNKLGCALLAGVMVLSFCPREGGDRDRRRIPLLALTLAIAFCIKVTFLLLGAGIFVVGEAATGLRNPARAASAIALAAGGCIVLVAIYGFATGISLADYIADIRLAAAAKSSAGSAFPWILYILWTPETAFYIAVPLVTAVLVAPEQAGETVTRWLVLTVTGIAVCLALPFTNSQSVEPYPAMALALVIAGANWRRGPVFERFGAASPAQRRAVRGLLALALSAAMVLVVVPNLAAEVYGRAITLGKWQGAQQILELPVRDGRPWQFYPHRSEPGEQAYVRGLIEGLHALRRHAPSGGSVAVLDFADPFPFLDGGFTQGDGALWWDAGLNITEALIPRAPSPIAHACIVLYPKVPYRAATRDFLFAWVRETLARDYRPLFETPRWRAWRAKADCR